MGRAWRGFGAAEAPELTGAEFVAMVLSSGDGLASAARELTAKSAGPEDMAKIEAEAEAAADAEREASRAWAQGAAGTVGAIGAYVSTTVVGAPVGLAIVAAAALAYGAYEGLLKLVDIFEPDLDGSHEQERVTNEIAWFVEHGLPCPEWNRDRHGHLRYFANELQEARQVIEGTNPAIVRIGGLFIERLRARDPYVLAALLVGGEGGRNWVLSGAISGEQGTLSDRTHLATNRQALELLLLAVGTAVAQSRDLPRTYWQAVIDHGRMGWAQGITDAAKNGVYHRGAVAFATAALQTEAMADALRAQLDAVEAASPGAVEAVFGPRYTGRAEVAGSRFDLLTRETTGAKARAARAAELRREVGDALKPPPPVAPPLTGAQVAIGGGVALGVGAFFLRYVAGAGLRRVLGF